MTESVRTLAVANCPPGSKVGLHVKQYIWRYVIAKPDGYASWDEVSECLGDSDVSIVADGYEDYIQHFTWHHLPDDALLPRPLNQQITVGIEIPALTPLVVALPRLYTQGDQFVSTGGGRWVYKMMSGFSDYDRYRRGEDITGILREAKDLGANGRRVFFAVDSFAHIWPQEDPTFYDKIPGFLDLLASYGLYCEMTNGDLQVVMPARQDQIAHFNRLLDTARSKTNVLFEFANESEKNGLDVVAALTVNRTGVLCSLGSSLGGDKCPLPGMDWAGQHTRRDIGPEMYGDMCPLYQQTGYTGYQGVGCIPVPDNEPLGFAEQDQPGRRSSNPQVAYRIARMSSAWNGACFHSDSGIVSQPLGPVQKSCAQAFYDGMRGV